jgi:TPR repeat protein
MYETGAGGQYRPDDAAYLYNADFDKKSFRALERLANSGNAEAQILLSANYEIWKRDIVKAIELEKKSAEQGHLKALCKRGERLIEGKGVRQDMVEGIKLIRASASKFDPCGMARMGILYLEGNGVEQSFEKAVNYLMSADRMHSADAGMRVDEAMVARRNELNEIAREKERIRAAAAERQRARERAAEAKRKHEAWKAERRARAARKAAQPSYSWEQGFRDFSPFRANGSYKQCSKNSNGKVTCY